MTDDEKIVSKAQKLWEESDKFNIYENGEDITTQWMQYASKKEKLTMYYYCLQDTENNIFKKISLWWNYRKALRRSKFNV